MKHSKRFLSILLVLLLCLSFAGCGGKTKPESETPKQNEQTNQQPEENNDTSNPNSEKPNPETPSSEAPSSSEADKSPSKNPGSSFVTSPTTPGGSESNVYTKPSPENPKTDNSEIINAKNSADTVYREFIVNYIEGNAAGVFGTLSAPAILSMKEYYGSENGKTASEVSDVDLKIYLMQTFAVFPEAGTLIYTVTCKVKEYYLKDSYEYIDNVVTYYNGNEDNIKAFAEVYFVVESTGNILAESTGITVLVGDTWQVITTKINLPM